MQTPHPPSDTSAQCCERWVGLHRCDDSFRSDGADCGGFCAAAALHGRKVFEGRAKLRRPPERIAYIHVRDGRALRTHGYAA